MSEDYTPQIEPLERLKAGHYKTADGRLEIHRSREGCWIATSVDNDDPDWFMLPSIQPRKASTCKELICWLKMPLFESRPLTVRPLSRKEESYEDDATGEYIDSSYWVSADRRLQFRRYEADPSQGWEMDADALMINPVLSARSPEWASIQLAALLHDFPIWHSWKVRHGLDMPLKALRELVARTEHAIKVEPPHTLFLSAKDAHRLRLVGPDGKSFCSK